MMVISGSRISLDLSLTLGPCLPHNALHVLTWAMSRYRLPVDAVLPIYTAAGIADLTGRVRRRKIPSAA